MQENIIKLKHELQSASGEQKVAVLNHLSHTYLKESPEKSLSYGKEALHLSEKNGYEKRKPDALNNIASAYLYLSDYDNALEHLLSALRAYEILEDKKGIANALNGIGIVYICLGNFDKSLKYHLQTLQLNEELEDESGIDASLNNIGVAYGNLNDYEKALEYFLKALQIRKKIGDKYRIAESLFNIGRIYRVLEDYDKSLKYYLQSLEINQETNDKNGAAHTLSNLGEIYIGLNDFEKAEKFLSQGLEVSKEIKEKSLISHCYGYYSQLYEAKEDYKKALEYFKLYTETRKEINNKETEVKIAEMQTQYEIEKKEQESEIYRLKNVELEKMVTQRTRQLEEALKREKELSDLKFRFINLTSHELRTPLTVLSGYSYILKSDIDNKKGYPKLLENAHVIDKSVRGLTRIVNNICNLSKFKKQEFYVQMGVISLNNLIKDIEKQVRPFTEKRKQRLSLFFLSDEVILTANYDLIWQALMNIVLNAIRFTPDHGKIWIKLEVKGEYAQISVADTGIGIPEGEYEKIFTDFYNIGDIFLHTTGTIEFRSGGIGIGLSIAKSAVELHNGKIGVESKLDEGSKFFIQLPLKS